VSLKKEQLSNSGSHPHLNMDF